MHGQRKKFEVELFEVQVGALMKTRREIIDKRNPVASIIFKIDTPLSFVAECKEYESERYYFVGCGLHLSHKIVENR